MTNNILIQILSWTKTFIFTGGKDNKKIDIGTVIFNKKYNKTHITAV